MRLAIFILLSSATMVAATDQYQVQIVRTSASSNKIDKCKEPVQALEVVFQTLTLKSGATYERRPVAEAMADYIESTAVELGVVPDLLPCSKEAGRTGHNTFMIRQGKCLASNFSVPELCAGTDKEVVYTASDLLSPDIGLPVSEISNLAVSMEAELDKFKVTVVFDEKSLLPDLYSYRLEFDGRTEEVTSGAEIIVEGLTSCFDLVFTLTPYIRDDEKGGSSAVYMLQADGIPPPEFSISADAINNEPRKLTFNLTGSVKDPCHTVVGYTISLFDSFLKNPNQTLEFSATETEIVLTCKQTEIFFQLGLNVKTIEGVGTPEMFIMNPLRLETAGKFYNTTFGFCSLYVGEVFRNSTQDICESLGAKQIDRLYISQLPIIEGIVINGWLPLDFNKTADLWEWDDGTFMSKNDSLWEPSQGIPIIEWHKPYFSSLSGKIRVLSERTPLLSWCYLEDDQ